MGLGTIRRDNRGICGAVMGSLWGTQGTHGVVKGEVGVVRGSVGAQRVRKWDVGSRDGMWGQEMGHGVIRRDNRGM